MAEQKLNWEIVTRSEPLYLKAHKLDVDEQSLLRLYDYKEMAGYAVPQLTTVAVFSATAWLSVREITDQEFAQQTEDDA